MLNYTDYILKFFHYDTSPVLPNNLNIESITCNCRAHLTEDHSILEEMITVTAVADNPGYKLHFGLIGIYDKNLMNEIPDGLNDKVIYFIGNQLYILASNLIDEMIQNNHIYFPYLGDSQIKPQFQLDK